MHFKILGLLVLITLSSCNAQTQLDEFKFLIGAWQVENKETYEEWSKQDHQTLVGSSYKIKEGQKLITETLFIKEDDGSTIYEATVPDQNDGATIPFTLNKSVSDKFSFENIRHDFPKKIQYQPIDDSKILVHVLGDNDEGFSYYILRR